ncbi:hypothetical protein CVU37_00840 [candidate division BRC1 bacterium HGW-BRC1-1]|nr:MAG: hypothetical protein CVU37_00840 [candidate division BRC1 bacterium HGW-BRC1-1]
MGEPAVRAIVVAMLMLMILGAPATHRDAVAQGAPAHVAACTGPRVAVLDFPMAPRLTEWRDENRQLQRDVKPVKAEKEIRGWWFNSQNIYFNGNLGRIAGDLYADALRGTGVMQVVSRQDIKYYYASKREKLAAKFKLTDEEMNAALAKIDPLAIGRELGVDKVVVGRICDSELRHSRTFGYFGTAQSLNVVVLDVATGQAEYERGAFGFKGRTTQYGALEEEAGKFAADYARLPR